MTDSDRDGHWFVVVPDTAEGAAVSRRVGVRPVLAYQSGRPCLIVNGPAGVLHTGPGPVRMAVIGCTRVTAAELARRAGRIGCLEDADAVARRLTGSFHLVVAVGDRVRVQGNASGVRRVFRAESGGAVVAASRAGVLAALTGASLDTEALAVRLLSAVPSALADPLWQGIDEVPPGTALHIDPRQGGRGRYRMWWAPPEPELTLEQGAPIFADALARAVETRAVETRATIASDLSGGLDSTPVAFLADAAIRRHGGRLLTFGMGVDDPAHDDHLWIARARAHLTGEHVQSGPGELPTWFAGISTPVAGLDEPMPWLRTLTRLKATAALLASRGATVHLTGHGGDEITHLPHSYLHELARTRPGALWPRLRVLRSRTRWPITACLRALADNRGYPAWLAAQAPPPTTQKTQQTLCGTPEFGWEAPLWLPSWTTPAVAATVASRLRAADARPSAPDRTQHRVLSAVRATARTIAAVGELTSLAGAAVHAPFLDDQVIAAALAIRLDHRAIPGRYKPLTIAAMSPHLPRECLTRTTKGEFSAELYAGMRANRDQLRALAEDSLLAGLGFADPGELRLACGQTPAGGGPGSASLDTFISTENWLRAGYGTPVITIPQKLSHSTL